MGKSRFPLDFMFQLAQEEWDALRSQFATLKAARGQHRKYLPHAFTEHGAIMAATILNSPRATEVSVYVVRAFVRLRETLGAHKELAAKLEELEQKTEALALRHDTLAANTRGMMRCSLSRHPAEYRPQCPTRSIELSKLRDTVRQTIVIPSPPPGINFARNLLFSHPEADSSGFALGMTLLNQVCHLLRKAQ